MRLITPHLKRCFEISAAFEHRAIHSSGLETLLDGLAASVFLCAADGAVVHMNRAANAIRRPVQRSASKA